tara:strand:- start:705 stop:1031 length:327 start_codon:yes stop_codon:yes gene_type:complete
MVAAFCVTILCRCGYCASSSSPQQLARRTQYSNLRGEPSECSWDGSDDAPSPFDPSRLPTCCALRIDDNASCASTTNEQDLQEWGDFELDEWNDDEDNRPGSATAFRT